MDKFERYLGDGVYAHFDGYQIWLTTHEGHRIALEPSVMDALQAYERDLRQALVSHAANMTNVEASGATLTGETDAAAVMCDHCFAAPEDPCLYPGATCPGRAPGKIPT